MFRDDWLIVTGPCAAIFDLTPAWCATGTSPVDATLVTWIRPAGAVRLAWEIEIGPPTMPRLAFTGTLSWLRLIVIASGEAFMKPNAAGGAAVSVLPFAGFE